MVAVRHLARRPRWVSLPFTDYCPPLAASADRGVGAGPGAAGRLARGRTGKCRAPGAAARRHAGRPPGAAPCAGTGPGPGSRPCPVPSVAGAAQHPPGRAGGARGQAVHRAARSAHHVLRPSPPDATSPGGTDPAASLLPPHRGAAPGCGQWLGGCGGGCWTARGGRLLPGRQRDGHLQVRGLGRRRLEAAAEPPAVLARHPRRLRGRATTPSTSDAPMRDTTAWRRSSAHGARGKRRSPTRRWASSRPATRGTGPPVACWAG